MLRIRARYAESFRGHHLCGKSVEQKSNPEVDLNTNARNHNPGVIQSGQRQPAISTRASPRPITRQDRKSLRSCAGYQRSLADKLAMIFALACHPLQFAEKKSPFRWR